MYVWCKHVCTFLEPPITANERCIICGEIMNFTTSSGAMSCPRPWTRPRLKALSLSILSWWLMPERFIVLIYILPSRPSPSAYTNHTPMDDRGHVAIVKVSLSLISFFLCSDLPSITTLFPMIGCAWWCSMLSMWALSDAILMSGKTWQLKTFWPHATPIEIRTHLTA